MITHYLGTDEVIAYSRDLALRLNKLGNSAPTTWCALGGSGYKMAETVFKALDAMGHQAYLRKIDVAVANYDRTNNAINFADSYDLKGKPVFVIDSAVHSGRSMMALVKELRAAGVSSTLTYGLVLKSGSLVVPNYFGVIIDEKDRTYFELPEIPNNRLHNQKPPIGILRQLRNDDVDKHLGSIGAPFDQLTIGDLLYDRDANDAKVYVFEDNNQIMGFVSFRKRHNTVFIDALATVESYREKGVGGALLRWAETWARSQKCTGIELWAFEGAIDTYERFKYEYVDTDWRNLGDGQRYKIMRKPLMYNVSVKAGEESYF